MFSYIKAVSFEVFIKAFCFLKYKQSFLISHEDLYCGYLSYITPEKPDTLMKIYPKHCGFSSLYRIVVL